MQQVATILSSMYQNIEKVQMNMHPEEAYFISYSPYFFSEVSDMMSHCCFFLSTCKE
jgi:hypothetical protein